MTADDSNLDEASSDLERSDQERDTRAVIEDHLKRREEGDLEADLRRNYAEDVVVLTPTRVGRGHEGVRECAELLYRAIQDAQTYEYSSIVCDDRVALLEWSASGENMQISDGVDSFLIENGLICVQTIRYTVTFKDLSQAREIA